VGIAAPTVDPVLRDWDGLITAHPLHRDGRVAAFLRSSTVRPSGGLETMKGPFLRMTSCRIAFQVDLSASIECRRLHVWSVPIFWPSTRVPNLKARMRTCDTEITSNGSESNAISIHMSAGRPSSSDVAVLLNIWERLGGKVKLVRWKLRSKGNPNHCAVAGMSF
jgi:hypothetical protein